MKCQVFQENIDVYISAYDSLVYYITLANCIKSLVITLLAEDPKTDKVEFTLYGYDNNALRGSTVLNLVLSIFFLQNDLEYELKFHCFGVKTSKYYTMIK